MIEWNKTSKREDTDIAKRRVWRSKCGHYKVEESQINYGNGKDRHGVETGYATCYRAMVRNDWGWKILSDEFRKRTTAMLALDHYLAHGHMPEKKKRIKKVRHADTSNDT